jgi:hypothetical protein
MQRKPIVGVPLRGHGDTVHGFAVIDEEDWPKVRRYFWHLSSKGYAVSRIDGRMTGMHRLLLDAPDGMQVDHINHDPLDNRRVNLHLVDYSANQQNLRAGAHAGTSSQYRGVSWYARKNCWRVQAKVNKKTYWLGYYKDEDEAGRVAAEFRRTHMPNSVEARNDRSGTDRDGSRGQRAA